MTHNNRGRPEKYDEFLLSQKGFPASGTRPENNPTAGFQITEDVCTGGLKDCR